VKLGSRRRQRSPLGSGSSAIAAASHGGARRHAAAESSSPSAPRPGRADPHRAGVHGARAGTRGGGAQGVRCVDARDAEHLL